jgi:hypothetical protein
MVAQARAIALMAEKALPALRETDPKTLLARYLSDESTESIASDYGVTRQALGKYLLEAAEGEWKAAQVARAIARKEEAEDDVSAARTSLKGSPDREAREVALARVRIAETQLKAAQWDLERVCKRIYGQDQPTATSAVQINISLRRDGAVEAVNETLNNRAASTVSHAPVRDVQPQHYDSEAPQHEPITPGLNVDKSGK